jgi:hypothetical protein
LIVASETNAEKTRKPESPASSQTPSFTSHEEEERNKKEKEEEHKK